MSHILNVSHALWRKGESVNLIIISVIFMLLSYSYPDHIIVNIAVLKSVI